MAQNEGLSERARHLRELHSAIGFGELGCLGYLWFCVVARRRDCWLGVSVTVLAAEGVALLVARGCPLGIFQRRAGDDVPMFELWFGRRLAPFAIPAFSVTTLLGFVLLLVRRPSPIKDGRPDRTDGTSWSRLRQR
jgi:hypothetical protein